jgi:hypothetical protein
MQRDSGSGDELSAVHGWQPSVDSGAGKILKTYVKAEWNGRNHSVHRYKRVNGIGSRADGEVMKVNYLYFEIYNREKKAVTYKNSRVTNLEIKESNVKSMTGRTQALVP